MSNKPDKNTTSSNRGMVLGPAELRQALRERRIGKGWRYSNKAAERLIAEQYDIRSHENCVMYGRVGDPHSPAADALLDHKDDRFYGPTALATPESKEKI